MKKPHRHVQELSKTTREVARALLAATSERCGTCLIWRGIVNNRGGYGVIYLGSNQKILAHRAAYLLYNGPIAGKLKVCHKCDTPACVEPSHLFLGTDSDNAKDAVRKGRHVGFSRRKLTLESVQQIDVRLRAGEAPLAIAKDLHLHSSTIYSIRAGKMWSAKVRAAAAKHPGPSRRRGV